MSNVLATPAASTEGQDAACLMRVHRALDQLSGARRRVAESILESPWDAHGLSIGELADRSGVSENAVNRFARSIGYSGYRAFSQALALDLGRTLGVMHSQPLEVIQQPDDGTPSLTRLFARVFEMEIAAMRDTLANLDEANVSRAVAAMAKAERILFVGTGTAASLCQIAQYRCGNLGLVASWASDPMIMVSEASLLREGDAILGVSYSGVSRATLEVLDYAARKRHATAIALTATRGSRIVAIVDIALAVFGPGVSVAAGQFTARTAGMAFLEALITAVAVEKLGTMSPALDELGEVQMRINNVDREWQPAHMGIRTGRERTDRKASGH
jgi:RpiR family transcriptional regulator, carbohydrate utilization regulator